MSGPYPSHAEIVARRRAERRAQLIAAARAAEAAARKHGLRMLVFGSVAAGEVHESSDLDLALDGPWMQALEATGEVFSAAGRMGFEPDIVLLERAAPSLRERILRDGRRASELA
ncbi:MAG: nucleotidyltransferase domain-containing protein [Acetobacteraceae bacterium]|nr:nucleotidyltransferase domain-containing protein [Acetobacteraceae bacterium]